MNTDYHTYWESCWQEEDSTQLLTYLEGWKNYHGREIEILKAYQVKTVCDAACGFGAYTVAFAANGFEVSGFDISPASVEITKQGLAQSGFATVDVKIANLLNTCYEDESFDGTEEDDFIEEHIEIEPGTMQYISGERTGMLFHPYDWEEIERLLEGHEVVEKWSDRRGEKIVVLRK